MSLPLGSHLENDEIQTIIALLNEALMNKPEPLVSVIALCFNQEEFLVETLDSVKNKRTKT